jgi:hypothetical protein
MLSHLFRQEVETLDSKNLMHVTIARLEDMGLVYDARANTELKRKLEREGLDRGILDGEFGYSEGQIVPNRMIFSKQPSTGKGHGESGALPETYCEAIIHRDAPDAELRSMDIIELVRKFAAPGPHEEEQAGASVKINFVTVEKFLTQPHPHPFKSAARRISSDLRQLVAV